MDRTPTAGKYLLVRSLFEKCGKIWKNGRLCGRLWPIGEILHGRLWPDRDLKGICYT